MTFFTAERRQAIQAFLVTVAPLLILGGFTNQAGSEAFLVISGAILQAIGGLLALVNLKVGDVARGWAIIRGVIYTLATTVAPALVVLGVLNPDTSASLLTGLSLALSSLSSAVAIFWSGAQQKVAAVAAAVDHGDIGYVSDPGIESRSTFQRPDLNA